MAVVACVLAGISVCLSLFAAFYVQRLSQYMPTASKVSRWRSETGDLEERMESLETRLRRLSSKHAMRDRRQKGKVNGTDDPQDPEEWKRMMNRKLATGEVKVR